MGTYYIGRFSIAVPVDMHEAKGSRSHELRYEEVKEIMWPEGTSHENAREAEWKRFMAKIRELSPPKGKDNVIIRMRDFNNIGNWAKAVFYYNDEFDCNSGPWAFLMDSGPIGVWIKDNPPGNVEAENKTDNAINSITNIGRSYRTIYPNAPRPKGDWFYLKHGAINLPYLWQEKYYIRFEGHPLDLKIEIEMNMDSEYGIEKHGLIDKTNAVIASGYAAAANVKLKRIRSQKRDVAGMPGEEEIDKIADKDKKTLDFGWEYIGKENSGEYPTLRITMESPDGNLEEKLKIWDAVLDSMKPMFVRK